MLNIVQSYIIRKNATKKTALLFIMRKNAQILHERRRGSL